jgi:hypothetical protein
MGKNQYDYNNYISSELIFQGGVLLEKCWQTAHSDVRLPAEIMSLSLPFASLSPCFRF